jgi:hypothetical protein
VEVREEAGEVVEAEDGRRPRLALTCRYSLHSKWIAARPLHFILGLAVRAGSCFLDLLSQPGGTHDAHTAYTFMTAQNFLHSTSLLDLGYSWTCVLVRRWFCSRMQPVLRHFVRTPRQRLYFHPVEMIQGHSSSPHRICLLYCFDDIGLRQGCCFY